MKARTRARGIALQLQSENVGVAHQQTDVCVPHRLEDGGRVGRVVPCRLAGLLECELRPAEAVADCRYEELLLRAEELEQVGLRNAGPPRDCVRRSAGVARLGKFDGRAVMRRSVLAGMKPVYSPPDRQRIFASSLTIWS